MWRTHQHRAFIDLDPHRALGDLDRQHRAHDLHACGVRLDRPAPRPTRRHRKSRLTSPHEHDEITRCRRQALDARAWQRLDP
jgi:hypothetical protein